MINTLSLAVHQVGNKRKKLVTDCYNLSALCAEMSDWSCLLFQNNIMAKQRRVVCRHCNEKVRRSRIATHVCVTTDKVTAEDPSVPYKEPSPQVFRESVRTAVEKTYLYAYQCVPFALIDAVIKKVSPVLNTAARHAVIITMESMAERGRLILADAKKLLDPEIFKDLTETAGSATQQLGAEDFITDTASEHTDSEDKSAPAELAELSRSTEAEIALVEEGETEQPGDATDLEAENQSVTAKSSEEEKKKSSELGDSDGDIQGAVNATASKVQLKSVVEGTRVSDRFPRKKRSYGTLPAPSGSSMPDFRSRDSRMQSPSPDHHLPSSGRPRQSESRSPSRKCDQRSERRDARESVERYRGRGGTRPAAREFPRRRGRILRPWYNSSRSGNYEESRSIDSHRRSVESGGSTQGRRAFLVERMMRMSDVEFERYESAAVSRGHLPKH